MSLFKASTSNTVPTMAKMDTTVEMLLSSQTAMTGLPMVNSDDVRINENVFIDIGYHGLLLTNRRPTRSVEVFNNYFD